MANPEKVTATNTTTHRVRTSYAVKAVCCVKKAYHLQGAVNVFLTDDAHIRELNSSFRQVDSATDVLTFAAPPDIPGMPKMLGEIAISVEMAAKQAQARKVSVSQEVGMLALHGALHLAGLNDETDKERDRMLETMAKLAPECGLKADPGWFSHHYSL